MEALNRMMLATMDNRLLWEFLMGSKNHEEMIVSHLLFANFVTCGVYSYALKWCQG